MLDVFQRLHRLSISAKSGRTAKAVEAARKAEEEKWKKRLAAECRIVTQNPHEFVRGTVSVPCLLVSSAKTKQRPQSALVRKVSTVLSRDGSVSSTQYYIVTDSVEPPPYHAQTPRRLQSKQKRGNERDGVYETQGMRREIQHFKKRTIAYGSYPRVVEEKMVEAESGDDSQDGSEEGHVIQVDFNNPLRLDKEIEPTQMISSTGQQWENNGYPTSVSYIMD